MKFQGTLTADDYVKAHFLHLRPRPFFTALGIAFLAMTYAVAFIAVMQAKGNSNAPLWLALFLILLAANFLIFLPYRTRKAFRRKKTLQHPIDYELTQDSLVSYGAFGSTRLHWRDFTAYKVSRNLILLYSGDMPHMFPRKWFTPEQFSELQKILAQRLGKAAE